MSYFKVLKFKSHQFLEGWKSATHDFTNGYGVSVILKPIWNGYDEGYELAVLKNGSLCYDSGITDGVIRDLTEDEVSELMLQISFLSSPGIQGDMPDSL